MKTKLWIISVILAGLWGLGMNNNANAQVLIEENFDYVDGTTLISNGWAQTGSSTTNPVLVTTPGLSFAGYASSGIGNAAGVNNSGQDVNKTFTALTADSVYAAFVIQTESTNAAGCFIHFGLTPFSTTFCARLWVNATGDSLGFSTSTSTAPTRYFPFTAGTPTLIVLKHSFNTHKSSLYIFDTFPTAEPATADTTMAETIANIGGIGLRQYNAAQRITVDGIRIATNWADAVAAATVIPDIIPPVVDTAFATSFSTVKVVFNEVVDNVTAETLTNYSGLAGIGTAVLNTGMDTVTLTLSTPLLDNVADTVCIANVEDTAGNVMAASQCFRLLFTTGDIIPPVVDTAWAASLSTVKVVFNEAMDDATAETTANYTGLPGISTAVLNTSMDTVTLTLSTPLTFGIPDTLIVNNVEDTAGNAMAAAQSFRVIYGVLDVTPPTVINAWPETHAVVKVKFSEAMDDVTAETVANYTGLAGIGSATLNATMDTVTLALSTNLINGIADTLYVQNVEDTAGNAMTAQQMFVLMLDTATTPKALVITEIMYNPIEGPTDTTEFIEIYNNDVVSVDLMNYTLTYNTNAFTFPTSVVLNPGEYALVAQNATAATAFYGMPFIQGNTQGVNNGGTVVKLKSPGGLLVDSLVYDDIAPWDTLADGDGYSLTLCDPDLDNTVAANWSLGTVLYGTSSYADPGQGCVTPTDTTAPVALHASLTNLTTAVVTFNEALDMTSAQTTTHYIGLGVVSAAVLTNDTVVTLTLSAPLQNAQNYILEVTGISDLASNVMTITYEFPLMLDTTTSISEMTNTAIQIFPNPANDLINVAGTATASRIEMYNNMGMLVLSREADGNDSITIETSTLENGSYYINIRMNDGAVVTRPVVIIR